MKMNRNEMEALYAFGCPNLLLLQAACVEKP